MSTRRSDEGPSGRRRPSASPPGKVRGASTVSGGARSGRRGGAAALRVADVPSPAALSQLGRALRRIEAGPEGSGELALPDGSTLPVTHLDRVLYPEVGVTKGDVMRYYVRVARAVLPTLAGRPLVLTRWPRGVGGPSFHQHDPGESVPAGVAVTEVPTGEGERGRRLVGGSLGPLLYAVQMGAVGVDAWHSRVGSLDTPDYVVLDLDPSPGVPFDDVVALAVEVRAELMAAGLEPVMKTSGSRGLHLVAPLPRRTSYDQSAAIAERVAEAVVARRPELATAERSIAARPAGTIYVDHMQNARGKTLVAAFTLRARPSAPASAPITARMLAPGLDPMAFDIETVPRQLGVMLRRWEPLLAAIAP